MLASVMNGMTAASSPILYRLKLSPMSQLMFTLTLRFSSTVQRSHKFEPQLIANHRNDQQQPYSLA
jgi:hypothetical protein